MHRSKHSDHWQNLRMLRLSVWRAEPTGKHRAPRGSRDMIEATWTRRTAAPSFGVDLPDKGRATQLSSVTGRHRRIARFGALHQTAASLVHTSGAGSHRYQHGHTGTTAIIQGQNMPCGTGSLLGILLLPALPRAAATGLPRLPQARNKLVLLKDWPTGPRRISVRNRFRTYAPRFERVPSLGAAAGSRCVEGSEG